MAVRSPITREMEWFRGEDRVFDFEVLDADPDEDPDAAPIDIAAYTMKWTFSENAHPSSTKHIDAHTVTVAGTFNASRSVNTQRARVTVGAAETANIPGDIDRYHILRRTGSGTINVLAFGPAYLRESPV